MLKDEAGESLEVSGDRGGVRGVRNWLIPLAGFSLALLVGIRGASGVADGEYYRMLAAGEHRAVPTPFSVRVLGPAIAGWLGRVTGIGADHGFLVLSILSLATLLACLALLLRRWRVGAGLLAAIFLMPFWTGLFHDYFLPDLLHAALLGGMLLCLARGQYLLAMLLLFPEYLARDATLLVAVCLAIAAWRRIPFRTLTLGAVAAIAGLVASQHFGRLGAPSIDGLRGGAYLAGKVVWFLFRNLFGITLWTNTRPLCTPVWTMALPQGMHLGAIRLIGVCQPSLYGPTRTLLAGAGIFGIGPAIALFYWRPLVRCGGDAASLSRRDGLSIVLRFSLIYGFISLLSAPILAASIDRLVSYAWPLFLIALPAAIAAHPEPLQPRWGWLLGAHLLISWITWRAFLIQTPGPYVLVAGLAALAVNIAVYMGIRRNLRPVGAEFAAAN